MPSAGRHRQGRPAGVQKTPSPRRAPRFCPGRPPAEDEGVQTPPGQRPRAAEFCFRGTTSLAALLQAATLPRPCPQRAWMRCPVTGAKRRCATGAARPVPAGCSQGMFLFRPASAFSAPGGSLCAGSWAVQHKFFPEGHGRLSVRGELGEECVLFKAVWFVASLRCWLYFSPAAPICQLFFVRFVTFLAENLCKLQNIVQFEFFPAQETEAWSFGPRHSPANAAAPCPISPRPGKTPAVRCNFTILISFLPQIWYAKLYRV